jgi:predicted HicB family RNase H-like nuclease
LSFDSSSLLKTNKRGRNVVSVRKRKRAPGGGRKPSGPFAGKTSTFTTRIRPDTRRALQLDAEKAGISISQHAEHLLRMALHKPSRSQRRNQALAQAVVSLAESIERGTEASWREDTFTGRALLYGIDALILHYIPSEEKADIPPAIEAQAVKMPRGFADMLRTPEGFGQVAAYAIIAELESSTVPPDQRNEWTAPINLHVPQEIAQLIVRDLKLSERKNRPA